MTDAPSRYRDQTLAAFVDALAAASPVPGGGSASAVTASCAAALVRMVVSLSLERADCQPHRGTLRRASESCRAATDRLLELADADSAAYRAFSLALKLPKETDEQRSARGEAIRTAAREAALVPLEVVRACRDLLYDVEAIAGRSNLNCSSDVSTAAILAEAAARGAGDNVLVNLPFVKDERFAGQTTAELVGYLGEIEDLASQARSSALSREMRDPEEG